MATQFQSIYEMNLFWRKGSDGLKLNELYAYISL